MTEITLAIVDDRTGSLLIDSENTELATAVVDDLDETLGTPVEMGCARPTQVIHLDPVVSTIVGIRINGIWHDSLVEGPGRRSVVRMQGCPIRCPGCWVPETHDEDGGDLIDVDRLVDALLNPAFERDGVTILGGEPFAQPAALHSLIGELRGRHPDLHITVYTGYTLERLRQWSNADIAGVLSSIDVLIDGPYVAARASEAGPWTGSGNQRVHYFR